jgi:hypothetical protein
MAGIGVPGAPPEAVHYSETITIDWTTGEVKVTEREREGSQHRRVGQQVGERMLEGHAP